MRGLQVGLPHVGGREELVGHLLVEAIAREEAEKARRPKTETKPAAPEQLTIMEDPFRFPSFEDMAFLAEHAPKEPARMMPFTLKPSEREAMRQGGPWAIQRYPVPMVARPKERGGERPENPEWCRGFYRPRRLTADGVYVLRSLDPNGRGKAEPLTLGELPHLSLKAREAFLARRYTALDMVMRGYAFEDLGQYYHISRLEDRDSLRLDRYQRLGGRGAGMPTEAAALQWIALMRRATWEQLFAVEPYGKATMVQRVLDLLDRGWVESAPIQLGQGEIQSFGVTKQGMKEVLAKVPQAEIWGWGPRKPLPANREYHEQVVGDAIAYQIHIVSAETDKAPTSIWLDRGLRKLCLGMESVPDVRVGFELARGFETYFDMEVEGLGSDYRTMGHEGRLEGAKTYRVFSANGKERGGNNVLISR